MKSFCSGEQCSPINFAIKKSTSYKIVNSVHTKQQLKKRDAEGVIPYGFYGQISRREHRNSPDRGNVSEADKRAWAKRK